MALTVFYIALAAYVAAAVLAIGTLREKRGPAPDHTQWLAAAGLAAHTVSLVWLGVEERRLPAYTPFEALVLLLWCAQVGYFALDRWLRSRAFRAFVIPLIAAAALAVTAFVDPKAAPATGTRSLWLPVHAVTALLGAADFLLAFVVAVMYLVKQRLLKHKTVGPFLDRLPSLDALDRVNYRAVALGVPVFTFALVSGVVLAAETGPGWWANWMVAASLVAWVVFAVLLHVRLGAGLRGPKVAYLTILGFLLVVAILCGIAFVGDSLHRMRPAPQGARRAVAAGSEARHAP